MTTATDRKTAQKIRTRALGLALTTALLLGASAATASAGSNPTSRCEFASGYAPACQLTAGRADGWYAPEPTAPSWDQSRIH